MRSDNDKSGDQIGQRPAFSGKTPNRNWQYRQTEITVDGFVFLNNEHGYTHYWYDRRIELEQKPFFMRGTWHPAILLIKDVNLSVDDIFMFSQCLENAFLVAQLIKERTGKPIEENKIFNR